LVCSYLCGAIEQVWGRGWQPADVSRVVDRHLGPKHAHLVVQSIAEEAETYRSDRQTLASWSAQLDEIGAELRWGPAVDHLTHLGIDLGLDRRAVLQTAFELLVMLHHLPDVPQFCPPPSEWGHSSALDAAVTGRRQNDQVDVRYLERIRALLAKAESTKFEAEAESLVAKAQDLMTRHAIDAAPLSAHTAGMRSGERPTGMRIGVEDPYAQAKVHLLSEIGNASRCRTVWSKDFGFATRIGRRLREAANTTISDVREEQGSGFLPVLAERSRMVDDLRNETFGALQQCRSSANDHAGWAMGIAAADLAEISRGAQIDEKATA
jgi:hypothetical protein